VSQPTILPAAASAPSTPTAAIKNGGTLRSAIPADIASLDPHLYAAGAAQTVWLVNERLTAYDLQLHPQPWLPKAGTWRRTIRRSPFTCARA
jgi:ABC-type transport system substrate-binding protein